MVQEKSTSLLSFCISLNSSRVCLQKVSKSHKKLVQDHLSEKAASLATVEQKTSNDNYDHLKLGSTSREKNVFFRAMPEWKHFFSFMTKQSSKSLIFMRSNVSSVFVIGHGRVNWRVRASLHKKCMLISL